MEQPKLYRNVAFLPKRDAKQFLEEFSLDKRWKENAWVLDIGSGDGSTNKEVLQKFVPSSCRGIVGSDISKEMIDFAKVNYESERVKFILWDVSKEPPLQLKGAFDHAFSFYVLHWVKQQRAAFRNIYSTLADGGNCLLMFLGRYTVYEVFRVLSRTQKWADDLKDVEIFTSPYHDCENPEAEVADLMLSVGFKNVRVNVCEKKHVYDSEDKFKSLVKCINPFSVLNERWEEFMKDYFEAAANGPQVEYQLIVAYGSK